MSDNNDTISSNLLRIAADGSAEAINIVDVAGTVLYHNKAFSDLLGYDEDELVNLNLSDYIHRKDLRGIYETGQRLTSDTSRKETCDFRMFRKDGTQILSSSTFTAVQMPDGEFCFVSNIRDVGAERERARELSEALQEAEKATRTKSEFLANMSHEIRTPLNGVIGMAQVMAYGELSKDQSEQVATILESGQTLLSIVNDILDLSKIESGKMEISPIDTDLRHKLKRAERMHRIAAMEKGLDLQFFFDPSVPARMMIDPVRVRQCLDNLVSNAIKFTSEGRVLVVVTSSPIDDAQCLLTIHVSDTGIGLSKDVRSSIFDPFTQADGSITRRFGGTGLGLPIARQLARNMGGDLKVASELGKGSVFTFTFKAEIASRNTEDLIAEQQGQQPKALVQSALTGMRILLVDDNSINREVAKALLRIYGIRVEEAADGAEAVEKMMATPYSVVLMDVHMPKVDGVTALKKIRSVDSVNSDTPIIALTADAMEGDREKYLVMGFNEYASKPLSERDLIAAINRVVSGIQARQREAV